MGEIFKRPISKLISNEWPFSLVMVKNSGHKVFREENKNDESFMIAGQATFLMGGGQL